MEEGHVFTTSLVHSFFQYVFAYVSLLFPLNSISWVMHGKDVPDICKWTAITLGEMIGKHMSNCRFLS